MLRSGKFKKDDAFDEDKAVQAGLRSSADVVVMGKFLVINNKIQIQAKAVEVASNRIMVSQSVSSKTDAGMFTAIDKLAKGVSKEMKTKLPPVPQRVIVKERIKYKDRIVAQKKKKEKPMEKTKMASTSAMGRSYFGMIWRSAAAPGWGHLYAGEWRGWLYLGAWAATGAGFLITYLNSNSKQQDYDDATADFDSKYDAANSARKLTGYVSFAFVGVYLAALTDILITGRGFSSYERDQGRPTFSWKLHVSTQKQSLVFSKGF